jgi:hypothetical protein
MIAMKPKPLPQATLIYSPPGVGKTEFAAHYEDPVFIMVGNELGLLTLMNTGRVPPTPYWDKPVQTWLDLLVALDHIRCEQHDRRTLVIDTANGAQRLMKYHVVAEEFDNDESKFESYAKGWERCVGYWMHFLDVMQLIRTQRGMRIVLLAHSLVTNFRNPEGDDYQKHTPELQEKHIWNPTNAWCDNVFFMDMEVNAVKEKGSRGKGKKGKEHRQLYVEATPSHFAKNRFGLRQAISMGICGRDGFENFKRAVQETQKKTPKQPDKPSADNKPPAESKPGVESAREEPKATPSDAGTDASPSAPPTESGPDWMQTWKNRIEAADKLGPALSTFGDLVSDYNSAPEPDQLEHFPGIFSHWVLHCLSIDQAKALEQLRKKLATKHGLPEALVNHLQGLLLAKEPTT